ncbi:RNA polymerase-associated protein LEO1 [Perkinsela sp. CCAP 1560/4]|nr:RNA polymerase-associated protein LEO1 [Perkinsela sp. CCAP 1560/4]|eukprot:KNH03823.1 RNA polymerase-associated protein LEO1 [Perkinsela sp. CCAP 1560/4]
MRATDAHELLATPILSELFGDFGALFVKEHYQDMHDGSVAKNFLAIFARERRNQALDEFEACFGPNVRYDPQLGDEYGRKPKILRTDCPSDGTKSTATDSSSLVRLPVIHPHRQILHIDPTPFQPDTELPRNSTFRAVYTPENIIRSRCQNGREVSNARTVAWSNGDITVHIGDDVYKLQSENPTSDPHLVADKRSFQTIGPSGAANTQSDGYRSIARLKTPQNLRLFTPLQLSSVGKALAKEKQKHQKVNKLEHIPLRSSTSAESSYTSRQLRKESVIFDPNEEFVYDVIAQKDRRQTDSIEKIRETLLNEIHTIESAAAKLGVVDGREVLASCQAFRGIFQSDKHKELTELLGQCAAIRRLYEI